MSKVYSSNCSAAWQLLLEINLSKPSVSWSSAFESCKYKYLPKHPENQQHVWLPQQLHCPLLLAQRPELGNVSRSPDWSTSVRVLYAWTYVLVSCSTRVIVPRLDPLFQEKITIISRISVTAPFKSSVDVVVSVVVVVSRSLIIVLAFLVAIGLSFPWRKFLIVLTTNASGSQPSCSVFLVGSSA